MTKHESLAERRAKVCNLHHFPQEEHEPQTPETCVGGAARVVAVSRAAALDRVREGVALGCFFLGMAGTEDGDEVREQMLPFVERGEGDSNAEVRSRNSLPCTNLEWPRVAARCAPFFA